MKRIIFALVIVAVAAFAASAQLTFNVNDLINVKRVGDPQLSPDGKTVAYSIGVVDKAANKTVTQIWTMNVDGSNKRQVTKLGAASFAPFFTPDGKRIIFCTNYFATDARKRNFDLALINLDGTGIERVTYNESFDGFPMFSPDGKKLVFASNRNDAKEGDTNVFIADWVD